VTTSRRSKIKTSLTHPPSAIRVLFPRCSFVYESHIMPIRCRRRDLTRDNRLQMLTFRRLSMTYKAIANQFANVSIRQIENTVQTEHPTPQKRSGRPPLINDSQAQELYTFVYASKRNRRLPWCQLRFEHPIYE